MKAVQRKKPGAKKKDAAEKKVPLSLYCKARNKEVIDRECRLIIEKLDK